MTAPGPDDNLASVLQHLQRRPAPDVKIESIFERWQQRRQRAVLSAGLALVALVLTGVMLRRTPPEAPVHLELNVIEVPAEQNEGLAGDVLAEVYDPTGGMYGP